MSFRENFPASPRCNADLHDDERLLHDLLVMAVANWHGCIEKLWFDLMQDHRQSLDSDITNYFLTTHFLVLRRDEY